MDEMTMAVTAAFSQPVALAQREEWRRKIDALADASRSLPQIDFPLRHLFSRGVYAREGVWPAGAVIVGRVHKYSQINVLLSGVVSVLTENGIEHMQAPAVFESPAGARRAFYVHEDTRWMTICHVPGVEYGMGRMAMQSDLDDLECELSVAGYADYDAWVAQQAAVLLEDKG